MTIPPNPNQPPLPGGVAFTTAKINEAVTFEPNLRLGRAGEEREKNARTRDVLCEETFGGHHWQRVTNETPCQERVYWHCFQCGGSRDDEPDGLKAKRNRLLNELAGLEEDAQS